MSTSQKQSWQRMDEVIQQTWRDQSNEGDVGERSALDQSESGDELVPPMPEAAKVVDPRFASMKINADGVKVVLRRRA